MKCLSPRRITKNLDPTKFPDGLLVPCGQCMHCRLLIREQWTMRIIHESQSWDSCIFFTLTYDNDNLPENGSLCKPDLQKFFKRIRKYIGGKPIKYFACGEYGENTNRPHYHVIMFGLDYLYDRKTIKDCWHYCDWSSLGRSPFGDVCQQSIRYVVGYIEKTVLGLEAADEYGNRQKPFHLVSKGIGRAYAIKNKSNFELDGKCIVQGQKRDLPRYYTTITGLLRDNIKERAAIQEAEAVEAVLGIKLTRDELYHSGTVDDILKLEDLVQESAIQNDVNLKAKIAIKRRRSNKGM
ncbi:MAG: replication initiator protein [Microvirus sp.]|nr:MAG: replication initiator protein [Microvirus sp.]